MKVHRTAMKQYLDIASVKAGLRKLLLSRTLAWLAISAFVLTVLFKVALPLFVSTASVKLNMERALSSWTGARARILGDPDIRFWPHPALTLRTVTFEGGDKASPELLANADAIAAGFDLLAALRGTPVFYDFRLINPVFKIERRMDGSLNWRRAGWMADAVASASLETPSARNTPIGDIEIENGTLELTDRTTASAYRVTNISGSIEWPAPAAQISASLSAHMNGDRIEWSFVCDEPMMLLSGQNSTIQTSFASAALSFSFDGTGNASTYPFASGQLQLTANSLPALMSWHGAATLPPSTGTISVDTGVAISPGTLKMDNLSLSLNGTSATGVLDVAWRQQHRPRIEGTLAFERLDLASLLDSFLPVHPTSGTPDMSFLEQIDLDLRLSAREASYGAITLTDIAAGVLANNGRASLDIGDGSFSGGSLSGRIALAKDGADGGHLQFSLKNADLSPVAAGLGLQGPLPLGQGVLSVDLATTEPLSAMTMGGVSGEIRYFAINGALTNFNGPEFERLAAQGGFFKVNQAGDGSFAFTTAEIVAKLRQRVAELTKADIRGEGRTLSLAGLIPYRGASLALAGAIRPDDTTLSPVRFFVGGSWPNAIISPLAAIPAPQ